MNSSIKQIMKWGTTIWFGFKFCNGELLKAKLQQVWVVVLNIYQYNANQT